MIKRQVEFYRNYKIYYDPPPIRDRSYDYHYVYFDYVGPGDPRFGHAPICKGV